MANELKYDDLGIFRYTEAIRQEKQIRQAEEAGVDEASQNVPKGAGELLYRVIHSRPRVTEADMKNSIRVQCPNAECGRGRHGQQTGKKLPPTKWVIQLVDDHKEEKQLFHIPKVTRLK
ncbi:MAG: hypothetical protein M3347_12855 [Armatimonadota bacterium]|nr:hypothetical protein [Armatimonadota bacterium]